MKKTLLMLLIVVQASAFADTRPTNRYGLYLHKTTTGYEISDRLRLQKNDTIEPNSPYARLVRQQGFFEPYTPDLGGVFIDTTQIDCRTVEFFLKQLPSRALKVKVDLPTNSSTPSPFVVYIHGGGWHIGDEDSHEEQSRYFAANGIAGVRLTYTLIPEGGNFEMVKREINEALDIVFSNASTLGLDTTRFGFCGSSAGGYLSSYKAMTTPETKFYIGVCGLYDPTNIEDGYFPGKEGLIKFFGTTNRDSLKLVSPLHLVPKTPPATLLIHGTADPTINCAQANVFADAIRAKNVRSELALYEGYGHLFSRREFGDVYEQLVIKQLAFVQDVLGIGTQRASTLFRAGDRIAFVGNSITQNGNHLRYLMTYYATRYPYMNLNFLSAGVAGDTTEEINRRMRDDVLGQRPDLSVLMSGMNDAFRYEPITVLDSEQIEKCTRNCKKYEREYSKAIASLSGEGRRLVLLTPSIYDATAEIQGNAPNADINTMLESYTQIVKRLGQQTSAPVIDIWQGLMEINRKMQANNPAATIISTDRVHPDWAGGFAMAYLFFTQMGESALVSQVEVDAKSLLTKTDNAQVRGVTKKRSEISFFVHEGALPFPIDSSVRHLMSYLPFQDSMNLEILTVSGLSRGNYRLYVDGNPVGDYSYAELKDGINLSDNNKMPQYKQAQTVALLCEQMRVALKNKRDINYLEYQQFKGIEDTNDVEQCVMKARELLSSITGTNSWLKERLEWYIVMKAREGELNDKIKKIQHQIYIENRPKEHFYQLSKTR